MRLSLLGRVLHSGCLVDVASGAQIAFFSVRECHLTLGLLRALLSISFYLLEIMIEVILDERESK